MIKELLLYFALLLWFVVPIQAQPTIFAAAINVDPDDTAEIDIMAKDFDDLLGFQFAIDWDETVLEFITVHNFSIPQGGANNFNISNSGKLRLQWAGQPFTVSETEPLFTLRFKAIGAPNDTTSITFTDDAETGGTPFVIELIDGNSNLVNPIFESGFVKINGPMSSSNDHLFSTNTLHQNTPNPFHTQTLIIFELNKAENITFSIFDTVGHEILKRTAKYSVGQHHMIIENKELPASGIYVYQIRGEQSGEFSKRMIFTK